MGTYEGWVWVALARGGAVRHIQAGAADRPEPYCGARTSGEWRRLSADEAAEALEWPVRDGISRDLSRLLRRAALSMKEAAALAAAGGAARVSELSQRVADGLAEAANGWAYDDGGEDDDD